MGFKISSSGGSGGGLPDYSISRVLYHRKWINGNDVWEISYFSSIPAYNQANVLLETGLSNFEVVVPIEVGFSFLETASLQWQNHDSWRIYKTGSNMYLRILNSTPNTIYVSGVLKYTIETITIK